MLSQIAILEALIDQRLSENNPAKWARLNVEGTLTHWVKEQANLAAEAMASLGPEANGGQQREVASEYLNPLTTEQELEQKMEWNHPSMTPEQDWLNQKTRSGVIVLPKKDAQSS